MPQNVSISVGDIDRLSLAEAIFNRVCGEKQRHVTCGGDFVLVSVEGAAEKEIFTLQRMVRKVNGLSGRPNSLILCA